MANTSIVSQLVVFFMVIYHGTIRKKSPSNIPRKGMGPAGPDPLNFNSEKCLKNKGCLEDVCLPFLLGFR